MKCDTCWNARPILSENGWHYVCTLSPNAEMRCIVGKKDNYIKRPARKGGDTNG